MELKGTFQVDAIKKQTKAKFFKDLQVGEQFLLRVDKWNEKNYVEGKFPYWQPDYRYGQINGSVGAKLKDMYLTEFEEIFTPDDIERLGGLLLYRKGEYRQFRKEVYMKYGKLFEPQQQ